jgi:hypothetical protein
MEGGNKRGHGWLGIGAVIAGFVLVPLSLYVGAYYWTVYPRGFTGNIAGPPPSAEDMAVYDAGWAVPYYRVPYPVYEYVDERWAVTPIHLVDRQIRQKMWDNSSNYPSLRARGHSPGEMR